MKSIKDLTTEDLKGKKVLVRVDFNVPIENGEIKNTFRVDKAIPTIKYLREREARVILISHISRDSKESLKPVARYLNEHIQTGFSPDILIEERIDDLLEGGVLLLENLRMFKEEEENDEEFAKKLARLADLYVNDAFSASHRPHASIIGVPEHLPSYMGLLFEKEHTELKKIIDTEDILVILGGAKFKTKLPVIEKLLPRAKNIFLGGALAHVLWQARGLEIGESLIEEDVDLSPEILNNSKIILPTDVVVENKDGEKAVKKIEEVEKGDIIFDAGPRSVSEIEGLINGASFVLWNGPLGHFEKKYDKGTKEVAESLARASAYSVVGGGDTVSAISELELEDKFDFVSTAGGAMMTFIAEGTLPGIEVLTK